MAHLTRLVPVLLLVGCTTRGQGRPEKTTMPPTTEPTFEDEVAFLRRYGEVVVLADSSFGRIAVSPKYQGRVMTSAVAAGAARLGWINHPFLEAGRTGTQFDNYGGEDRFWLGPEGGQFGLYFAPSAQFTFGAWQTPAALNEGEWAVRERGERHVVLTHSLKVQNHGGAVFELVVDRAIAILSVSDVVARLGVPVPPSMRVVAFESVNRITNTGHDAWTKDAGLLSVWILGMYAPSPDARIVIPFETSAQGPIVNDRYFGKVPEDRLKVHEREGFLVFTGDGKHRSKIGVGPSRAKPVLGSYSESSRLLTLVQYDKPSGATDYVNSMWETQSAPYGGDTVNSYNDGPTEPGQPSLGGFYEMETSSPAAALAPGASLAHAHRTFHFVGERADLDAVARHVLGVGLDAISR
jgi:hypothetical protein